jgi:prevent-host-death family protein
MAHKYSLAEAKAQLPAIIDQAEEGETIELTRHGKSIAVVISLAEFERLKGSRSRSKFGDTYRAFLDKFSLTEVGVDKRFAASTRNRARGRAGHA